MASWQAKGRDPLFDQTTQAALERRGKELLGAGLIGLGALIALMLTSWSADDPSFLSATDAPAQNWLGTIGAYIASPLMMIAGYGAWTLVVGAVVWGMRLILHRGEERIMRGIFLPIAVALWSVYATSLVPPAGWVQNYGLGGHFGDMVMAALLNLLPFSPHVGIKIASLLMAVGAAGFTAFVLGFDAAELRVLWRRFVTGLVTAYDAGLRLAGQGAAASVTMAERMRERRAARAVAVPATDPAPVAPGIFGRRKPQPVEAGDDLVVGDLPEPELIDTEASWDGDAPSQDEVSHRITDAIRSRTGAGSVLAAVAARLSRDGGARADATPAAVEPAEPIPFGAETPRTVTPPARKPAPSRQAQAEAQPQLQFSDEASHYERPSLALLTAARESDRHQMSQ
ncbi:MAG: DNA translocase FtsK 4TM domain-containing protein, partial [Paracoccus sp. (in: a-proteobacteria)]|nr:DNA translocase FtsK 4TM domain-containing protein [Paracoccus sp. (in: a-proteobacteria)]